MLPYLRREFSSYIFFFFLKSTQLAIIGIVCDLGILKSYVNWWLVMNVVFFIGLKNEKRSKSSQRFLNEELRTWFLNTDISPIKLLFFFFWRETNQTTATSKVSAPLSLSYKRFSFVWLESLKIWKQLYRCYLFRRIFVC